MDLRNLVVHADVPGLLNIGLVTDNGAPIGQSGPPQGDTGQGDIRISARPLDPSTVAITTPFDLLGAWSGNVVLNSKTSFGDGPAGTQDLYDAILHEAGHAFGLDDNPADPTSNMYPADIPGRTGPSASDASALRAIYGNRQPDAQEGRWGNDSAWTATPLAFLNTPADLTSYHHGATVAEADITTPSDVDTYVFSTPHSCGGTFTVTVRASGLSLLTPRLTILDALGQSVAQSVTTNPLNNDLTVTVTSSLPGATFYAQVAGGQSGVFGIGAYRIAVGRSDLTGQATTPTTLVQGISDLGSHNNTIATASPLWPTAPADDLHWACTTGSSISTPGETDYYRFRTDQNASPYLLINAWGMETGGLTPRLAVFDTSGNPVPAQVAYCDANMCTLQVSQVQASTGYVVRVAAADPTSAHATGHYFLGIAARSQALPLQLAATNNLQGSQNQDDEALTVSASSLLHFDLSTTGPSQIGDAAVCVAIYDAQYRPVCSFRDVQGTGPATTDLLLVPGKYYIREVAGTRSGAALAALRYNLRIMTRSHPIGPNPIDTTFDPSGPTPVGPPTDPYQVTPLDPNSTSGLFGPVDSFSNPWTF